MSNLLLTMAGDVADLRGGFCANASDILQVIGYVLLVFKIVIPIILIILGMLDLGKAVVASKDDEIKKAMKSLAMRAISAVVIFFIPTIVGLVMGLVSNFSKSGAKADFEVCKSCLVSPGSSTCSSSADDLNDINSGEK